MKKESQRKSEILNHKSDMLNTIKAIVQKKRIHLIENIKIPERTKLLITILPNDDSNDFWQAASMTSLNKIWNNTEDNIYAELLEK